MGAYRCDGDPVQRQTGATFISSGGLIELKGNVNVGPYSGISERLVFFTPWDDGKTGNNRCDAEVLKVSGNCNHFDGVVYLPNGTYRASGEGNGNDHAGGSCGASPSNTYAGGIIAFGINISGNFNLHRGAVVAYGQGSPYLSD